MDDTQTLKAATAATLDATVLSFPRTAPVQGDKFDRRQSLADGSLNPIVMRIAHTPLSKSNKQQQTMATLDKTFSRVDGLGNVLSQDFCSIKVGLTRTAGVSEAEFITQLQRAIGWLFETRNSVSMAVAKQLYNTES